MIYNVPEARLHSLKLICEQQNALQTVIEADDRFEMMHQVAQLNSYDTLIHGMGNMFPMCRKCLGVYQFPTFRYIHVTKK